MPARTRTEWQRLIQSAPVRTRVAAGAAVLLGVAVVCGWGMRSSTGDLVPLGGPGGLSEEQSAAVRAEITAAGLPEPLERDGRLLVLESESERYQAALDRAAAPRTWAETWEEANSTLSRFSLSAERDDAREISRAKLASRILNEFPGVERADVVWDEERQPGWNRPPVVRATVYLNPRPGHRITLETVHAVRLAVAGSKAYLEPEGVVVIDLSRMAAFDESALGSDFAASYGRITRLSAEYRRRAEDALSHIPGASVAVAIEPIGVGRVRDPGRNSLPAQSEPEAVSRGSAFHQERPNTGLAIRTEPMPQREAVIAVPAEEEGDPDSSAARHEVVVSVSIPTSHYRQVAAERNLLPETTRNKAIQVLAAIEREVVSDVRSRLAALEAQIDPGNVRQTVSVESIEAVPLSEELLVAAPAPADSPVAGTLLSRFRTALIAVTVLVTCWLVWAIVRMVAARRHAEPGPAIPGPFASPETAERIAEVLNADRDGVVLHETVPAHPNAEDWDIDELAELSDARLRRLVRSVSIDTWPAALSSAAPATRRRLISALPDGEAEQLRNVLSHVRPIRLDDIDLAQREVQSALAGC